MSDMTRNDLQKDLPFCMKNLLASLSTGHGLEITKTVGNLPSLHTREINLPENMSIFWISNQSNPGLVIPTENLVGLYLPLSEGGGLLMKNTYI